MREGHYTEDELAEIARRSGEIEGHLETCTICRSRYEFLLAFYRSYESQKAQPATDELEQFIALRTLPNIIELKPYRARPDTQALGTGDHVLVLAAQDTATDDSPVTTEATFASQEPRVLFRVVRDRRHGSYTLHILGQADEIGDHVLVAIKEGEETTVIVPTDDRGIGKIVRSTPIDWTSSAVTILTPVVAFSLRDPSTLETGLSSGGVTLRIRRDAGRLLATISGESAERLTHALLVKSGGEFILKNILACQLPLDEEDLRDSAELRLFN